MQLSNLSSGCNGQQERVKIVAELSKRIGLDGLAFCAAQEDFTLANELNINFNEYERPWFD